MYRPVSLFNNEYSFMLMKNRHEEWGTIPNEYVQSVTYNTGSPTQMTIEIPAKVKYMNKEIDFDLYHEVRGKMQIIMNMNGEKSRFIIDDNIKVVNSKHKNVKTLTAFSFEKTLEKKNFIIPEGATRQLYRPKDEQVEISDGMLNWFEQQTNFTVGHVDELARKELGLYRDTQTWELLSNHIVDPVAIDGYMWHKDMWLDIGDVPLTFTISYTDMETYSGNQLQKRETITHSFNNLPYGVKRIEARYSSDSDYRFGMKYIITYVNDTKQEFKFGFANANQLKVVFPIIKLTFENGSMSEHLTTKYRYFEATSCSWLTLLSQIEEAFNCVCTFDSYNQVVNVYNKETHGEDTGIALSYDNSIKEINKTQKLTDIVTRLYVESPNVSIAEENPLGTEYVEDFSYYINNDIMSASLTQALTKYNKLVEEKNVEFLTLKLEKNRNDQLITKRQGELSSLQGRYKAENAILTAYIKDGNQEAKQKQQSELVSQIEREIANMMNTIQTLKDRSDSLFADMTKIGIDIQKENAMYNGAKIFSNSDLEELEDYLIESSISNDYYTLAYSLYQYAKEVIEDMNKVYIDFSISTSEFLSKIKTHGAWNESIKLGIKLSLDVENNDLTDDEGLLQLYGFTFKPNEGVNGSVTDLKFTNNKKPKATSIKTIGDISKKTAQLTTMTNFWKDTWSDSASSNVAVEKLLKEGLDVSAQIVRGKGTSNKIDISEAGIYISDAQDENKQIYYGSGLISITQDKWKTSTLAIDSSGIMAETVVGKLILGAKMQIGNENNTFEINPHGLSVKDPLAKQEERIFLGIEGDKAVFRLHSKSGNNKLVLSEDGIYQVFPIQVRDSFDRYNSFKVNFYLPNNLTRLDSATLNFNLEKFRTYSKSAKSHEQTTVTPTTSTYNGESKTTTWYGGETKTITSTHKGRYTKSETKTSSTQAQVSRTGTSTTNAQQSLSTTSSSGGYRALTQTTTHNGGKLVASQTPNLTVFKGHKHGVQVPDHSHSVTVVVPNHTHTSTVTVPAHNHQVTITIPAHSHTVGYEVNIPDHSHDVTYSIPSHAHSIDISKHSHTVDVVFPSHSHDITHGIYDYPHLALCDIYVDGRLVASNVNGDRTFNIASYLNTPYGGTHTIEVRSKSSANNPDGLGRANLSVAIGGFVSY